MKTNSANKQTYTSVEDYEANCYQLFPSISKRKNVGGKTYLVRRYFNGDKDFEKSMQSLASQHTFKNKR